MDLISTVIVPVMLQACYAVLGIALDPSPQNELRERLKAAFDSAVNEFTNLHGEALSPIDQSFIAREENWILLVKYVSGQIKSLQPCDLNPSRFDDGPPASKEMLSDFIACLECVLNQDLQIATLLEVRSIHKDVKHLGAQIKRETPRKSHESQPLTTNIPFIKNINFSGREDELDILAESLKSDCAVALTQALTGFGGVGKTQIALEYVYRNLDSYHVCWWVRAEQESAILADLAMLAAHLRITLAIGNNTPKDLVKALMETLSTTDFRWLLVFDNAPSSKALANYVRISRAGHIIITSQDAAWRSLAKPIKVDTWSIDESVKFLKRRTGVDDEAWRSVAEFLDGLPLALEQAGAYVEATGCCPSDYARLLEDDPFVLLAASGAPIEHQQGVEQTFALAFQKVSEASEGALALLQLISLFNPDEVPKKLLLKCGYSALGSLAQVLSGPLELNEALSHLKRFSLVDVQHYSVAMHRLIRLFVQQTLSEERRRSLIQVSLNGLKRLGDSAITNTTAPSVIPQSLAILEKSLTEPALAKLSGEVALATGRSLWRQGQYSKASEVILQAASALISAAPQEVKMRLALMTELCMALLEEGQISKAVETIEPLRDIAVEVGGSTAADLLNNLGIAYRRKGKLGEAIDAYEKSIRIREGLKTSEANSLALAESQGNLGVALSYGGGFSQAQKWLLRCLRTRQKVLGNESLEVAETLNNIGWLLRESGRPELAMIPLARSLSIREYLLPPHHLYTSVTRRNLGIAYKQAGDLAAARIVLLENLTERIAASASNPNMEIYVSQAEYDLAGVIEENGKAERLLISALSRLDLSVDLPLKEAIEQKLYDLREDIT